MLVEAIDDWGWWFKVGEIYDVRPYKYKATRGAFLNFCFCPECKAERDGKELLEMYEDKKTRGIIPVIACRPYSAGDR